MANHAVRERREMSNDKRINIYRYIYRHRFELLVVVEVQQRDPFLHERTPAETVMVPTRDDDLAPKLDAFA